ncbi:hypothetical protein U2F26_13295 [Micromonospora sp. 4G57]|uniref:Uncharacterized protein n=1 Tax=Micromonospora sicca TaxID=2202420 RepID=A0ABU5J8D5_9ACTN|nr:hypothetical protein [Micromonospora sp. 4G57]MDZ5443701.1 hypothetical protein [Micromonospora sp. 4G57]MDZ5488827.1 hypothetical protein [Micromonospora sp. 4G53]
MAAVDRAQGRVDLTADRGPHDLGADRVAVRTGEIHRPTDLSRAA